LSSDFNNLFNNIISYNGVMDCGLYIRDSDNNLISNNQIFNNGNKGILIEVDSTSNQITLNEITNHLNDGIYLHPGNNNTISGNIISNNEYAIRLWGSSNNIITDNIFNESQHWAVSFSQSSDNNQIYHNNFLSNLNNAWDEDTNFWDNGYPLCGNYFDNYTGLDSYHGADQNIPGSDGIGDIPYNISGGENIDLYPLILPYNSISKVYVDPITQIVGTNEIFNISIMCDLTQTIEGFEFDIDFNATHLQANEVSEGDIFEGYSTWFGEGTIDNTNGYINNIYGLIIEEGNVSEGGCCANISLTTEDVYGFTNITLCDVGIADNNGYLPRVYYNGSMLVAPNWDIDLDHDCNIMDLIFVANHFDETGPVGWIREDVNNDGEVSIVDLVLVAGHFDETW
jgi:parallel beta-helix repeat protein